MFWPNWLSSGVQDVELKEPVALLSRRSCFHFMSNASMHDNPKIIKSTHQQNKTKNVHTNKATMV
jgi:hypothetical protein